MEVEAIGVNYADVVVRMGLYASARDYVGWPITPGFELSGRVAEVGPGVHRFRPGQPVFGLTRFGAYATRVVLPEDQLFARPAGLSAEQSAGFPTVFLTAHYALFELARPGPGSRVLVHSAAGGVGLALVQLARSADCTVDAVVGAGHKLTTFESYELDPGRKWVRPTYSITETCSPSEACLTEEQSYFYCNNEDNRKLGLLQSITHNNQRFDGFEYAYTQETSVPYLVRKTHEYRSDLSGVMSDIRWQYDNDCEQPQVPMVLTKGKVCARSVDLNGGPEWATTEYAYDSTGRLASERDPDGSLVTFQYHAETPHLKERTNALGHTISYSEYYPLTGAPGRTCGPQSKSGVKRCEGAFFDDYGRVRLTTRDRDDGGTYRSYRYKQYVHEYRKTIEHVIRDKATDESCSPCSDDEMATTVYHFDAFGDPIAVENETDTSTAYDYYKYDTQGRVTKVWKAVQGVAPTEPGSPPDYEYTYDLLDRLTEAQMPDGGTQHWQYEGPVVHHTDARNGHTAMEVNNFREVVAVRRDVGAQSLDSYFMYDGAGRVTLAVDPSGAGYEYEHDRAGRVTRATLPTGQWIFDRRPSGKLLAQESANGAGVFLMYDDIGRVMRRAVDPPQSACGAEDGSVQWLFYEQSPPQLGRLAAVEANDHIMAFQYDALGNVTGKMLHDFESGASVSYQREFNTIGGITSTTTPIGNTYQLEYGEDNRPKHLRSNQGGFVLQLSIAARNRFGVPQQMIGEINPTLGFVRSYNYDALVRPTSLATAIPGHQWVAEYGYDLNGNVQWMEDNFRGISYSWIYDEANRMTSSTSGTPEGGPSFAYTYHGSGVPSVVWRGSDVAMYSYGPASSDLQGITSASENYMFMHDPSTGTRCEEELSSPGRNYFRAYRWTGDGRLAKVEHTEPGASFTISNW